ncbi:hypothetical protein Tco_0438050 [Tanacetum coccineum]
MENPEQAFVDYASTRTDEAGVSSTRSYPMKDPQSSSNSFKSVNAIKTCFISTTNIQKDQLQVKTLMVKEVETPKSKEPGKALEDEFKDLHLNLPVLEVPAHVPIYDALLDKYIKSLELGDSKPFDTLADLGSCVNLIPLNLFKKLKIGLLEETEDVLGLADGTKSYPVGIVKKCRGSRRGFLATASAVIDCKKDRIAIGEGITRSIFSVKEIDFGEENIPYWTTIGKRESYTPQPSTDGIVFRKMVDFLGTIPINLKGNMWEPEDLIVNKMDWSRPPKEGDGVWHIRIELIDPDGEKFNRAF